MRWLALLALVLAGPAWANLSPRDLAQAVARPPAGAVLPPAVWRDQHGAAATLAGVAAGRPLVLVFADYSCAHVCGPGLTLTAGALHDAGLVPGRDYALAVAGFDPRDTPAQAAAMAGRLAALPAEARAVRLLTGDAAAVAATTRALGYGVAYDPQHDQFAHDAVVYVFRRDGRLASVLPELELRPALLRAALAGAPDPSFAERVAHLCYGFAAAHGRYGAAVVWGLQGAALLLLAGGGAWLWRRRRVV